VTRGSIAADVEAAVAEAFDTTGCWAVALVETLGATAGAVEGDDAAVLLAGKSRTLIHG
jgi:hypothetical protein